jgi:PGAP1-like protein
MKYIKFSITLFLFLICYNCTFGQSKDLTLIHGLNESSSDWKVYNLNFFRSNFSKVDKVFTPDYYSQGPTTASSIIYNIFGTGQGSLKTADKNIVIGHSMGGVVALKADIDHINNNPKFGGIITMGSPNRGALVANAMLNGTLQNELQSGCVKITGAVSSSFIALSLSPNIVPLFLRSILLSGGLGLNIYSNNLCNMQISQVFSGYDSSINTQLSEGSPLISSINNQMTATPKIAVYGVEESPVHIRLLGSAISKPTDKPLDVSNTDEQMVAAFHATIDIFDLGEAYFAGNSVIDIIFGFIDWELWVAAAANGYAAYEFADASSWISNSESRWLQIIGAGGFYPENHIIRRLSAYWAQEYERVLDVVDVFKPNRQLVLNALAEARWILSVPGHYENVSITYQIPINYESDGFINAGSQRLLNDALDPSHIVNEKVNGVNHLEFYNRRNMTIEFKSILKGQTNANQFFNVN